MLTDATLTYCTNVLPGDTLDDVVRCLRRVAVPLARADEFRVPQDAFPVGLYLSATAVKELGDARRFDEFTGFLEEQGLRVATLNCFPYGGFHAERVKENVYRPGWHEEARLRYTLAAAELLARWVPEGTTAPISTLSGTFKDWCRDEDVERSAVLLARAADGLEKVHQRTGREIVLALEPEPFTTLETTEEVLAFFRDGLWAGAGLREWRRLGRDASAAHQNLARFVGLCYDTCHQAVEFENAADSVSRLCEAGVRIAKVQLSSALRLTPGGPPDEANLLDPFVEPRYLHQTFAMDEDGLRHAFVDLPDFLQWWRETAAPIREIRSHFHVPIDLPADHAPPLGTTREHLRDTLAELARRSLEPVLEVETYTFDVFPEEGALRPARLGLEESVAAELHAARADVAAAEPALDS